MILKGWSGAWPFSVRIMISLVNSAKRARPQLHRGNGFPCGGFSLQRPLGAWNCRTVGVRLNSCNRKEGWGENRSVMPLDNLGCTRTTFSSRTHWFLSPGHGGSNQRMYWIEDCKCLRKIGISRKRGSSSRTESVPVFCTHRPSLGPTSWLIERDSDVLPCGELNESSDMSL